MSRGDLTWPSAGSDWLFVNSSYKPLFRKCDELINHTGIQGIFLKGTPGIGKSCFLDYACHQFLQQGKTVLYSHGCRDLVYKFYPEREEGGFNVFKGVHNMLLTLEAANSPDVDIVLFDPHEDSKKTQNYE